MEDFSDGNFNSQIYDKNLLELQKLLDQIDAYNSSPKEGKGASKNKEKQINEAVNFYLKLKNGSNPIAHIIFE